MDPTSLIFVALAVAWAAYLIPKALEHHDAGDRAKSVTTFSERIRILARREAISRRATALVTAAKPAPAPSPATAVPAAPAEAKSAEAAAPTLPGTQVDERPLEVIVEEVLLEHHESVLETTQSGRLHLPHRAPAPRRSAAAVAAQRRRRVLWTLVFLTAAVGATAAGSVISWLWVLAPIALIAAWLVACRQMVTHERAAIRRNPGFSPSKPAFVAAEIRIPSASEGEGETGVEMGVEMGVEAAVEIVALADDDTTDIPAIPAEGTWTPVDAPLPTYVSKPAARRTITTIDLDATGVWTSGRTEADSALAREADAVRATPEPEQQKRVSGA